jgi:hypothetical protein
MKHDPGYPESKRPGWVLPAGQCMLMTLFMFMLGVAGGEMNGEGLANLTYLEIWFPPVFRYASGEDGFGTVTPLNRPAEELPAI